MSEEQQTDLDKLQQSYNLALDRLVVAEQALNELARHADNDVSDRALDALIAIRKIHHP